jgi:uncharacterized protein (DUF1499 family)
MMADRPFPIDFATLDRGAKPNTYLVLPKGFEAQAPVDQESPVWSAQPADLLAAFKAVALEAPRTELVREGDAQIELVQRSALFKFPDFITVEAVAVDGGAALCVFSRSKVGYSDLGVNAKRVTGWLATLQSRL